MRYPSTIEVASIERAIAREGFSNPYHRVTFTLSSDGIPASVLSVWVHPAYPDADLIQVARTFLWSRLATLCAVADAGRFLEAEIQALWEQVKPENFAAN